MPALRTICSTAESELETFWTNRILDGSIDTDDVFQRLKEFPYYNNYEALTRLELCAILSATACAPQKVAFLGSGPLPLTSLCLLTELKNASNGSLGALSKKTHDAGNEHVILNIDNDPTAIRLSETLSEALGERGKGMRFELADARAEGRSLGEFDVVYVAALVGHSQAEKEDILLKVVARMRTGALVVIRSAWGLRTCLYPRVDIATERLMKALEPCVVLHPYGEVVNSVIVAKKR